MPNDGRAAGSIRRTLMHDDVNLTRRSAAPFSLKEETRDKKNAVGKEKEPRPAGRYNACLRNKGGETLDDGLIIVVQLTRIGICDRQKDFPMS